MRQVKMLFFTLFVFLMNSHTTFAVKWKFADRWSPGIIETTKKLLHALKPLLHNKSFRKYLQPRLSLGKKVNIFEEIDSRIEQFEHASSESLTRENKEQLLGLLQKIIRPLIVCKDTIEQSAAMVLTSAEVIIEIETDEKEKIERAVPFMEYWKQYDEIIIELTCIYDKAISSTPCTIS
jgi:hypothetical protein